MRHVSFFDGFIKSGSIPVHFIVCRDGKNRLCHYFLMCTPQKLKLLRETKQDVLSLHEYGHIIASGFGRAPSAETKAMLKEQYGYDFEALS